MTANDINSNAAGTASGAEPGDSTILDVRGLQCPLPVLRANKAMKPLAAGHILEVLATDPAAPQDFVSFCETTGHHLVESREAEGVFTLIIQKSG